MITLASWPPAPPALPASYVAFPCDPEVTTATPQAVSTCRAGTTRESRANDSFGGQGTWLAMPGAPRIIPCCIPILILPI